MHLSPIHIFFLKNRIAGLFLLALSASCLQNCKNKTPAPLEPLVSGQFPSGSSHIAFLSNRSGNGDIYIIAKDGSGLERVTFSGESDFAPRWTRDGLVYANQTPDGEFLVKKFRLSLAEKVVCPNPAFEEVPEWSPDGRWMVFTQKDNAGTNLYLANPNGVPIRQLTNTGFQDKQPSFSPDGTKIVFTSDRSGNPDIWVLNLENLSVHNLTRHPAAEGHPRWSPLGDRILFYRLENENAELFTINVDGSEARNLTNSPENEMVGAFSPDGNFIAFSRGIKDNWELFVANADGSHARQLTFDPAFDGDPVWVPSFLDSGRVKKLFKQL